MLGNPFIQPWKELAALAEHVDIEESLLGSWYVCWGTKPAAVQKVSQTRELIAAE
jgi:hypothetical protein